MAEDKLDELHPEHIKKVLRVLAKRSTFNVRYCQIDDFMMMPKVLFIDWKFVIRIMFRPWPFLFSLTFPTRRNLVRWLIERGEASIWLSRPVIDVRWPKDWRPRKWQ